MKLMKRPVLSHGVRAHGFRAHGVKALGILALVGLAACGGGDRVLFDGKYYPAKAKKDGALERFVVTVRRADQGLEGAREAGRYEGTDYCIKKFGTSTIAWAPGPDADRAAILTDGGNVVLRGTCNKW